MKVYISNNIISNYYLFPQWREVGRSAQSILQLSRSWRYSRYSIYSKADGILYAGKRSLWDTSRSWKSLLSIVLATLCKLPVSPCKLCNHSQAASNHTILPLDQLTALDAENLIDAIDQQLDQERRQLADSLAAAAANSPLTKLDDERRQLAGSLAAAASATSPVTKIEEDEEMDEVAKEKAATTITTSTPTTTTTFYPLRHQLTHLPEEEEEEDSHLSKHQLLAALFNATTLKAWETLHGFFFCLLIWYCSVSTLLMTKCFFYTGH